MDKKKISRYFNGFICFVLVFSAFWIVGFLLLEIQEGISVLGIILLIAGVLTFLSIVIGLFLFFRRQVIEINLSEDQRIVSFILLNGKEYQYSIAEIVEIIDAPSRYVFTTSTGKHLSSYKFYSPRAVLKQHRAIGDIVDTSIFTSAQIKYKIW